MGSFGCAPLPVFLNDLVVSSSVSHWLATILLPWTRDKLMSLAARTGAMLRNSTARCIMILCSIRVAFLLESAHFQNWGYQAVQERKA